MKHPRSRLLALSLLFSGCGGPDDPGGGTSGSALESKLSGEEAELAELERALGDEVRDLFGSDAFIRAASSDGVLSIGLEPLPMESDALSGVALAMLDAGSGRIELLEKEASFVEARVVKGGLLAVQVDGELRFMSDGGSHETIAKNVRGDLAPSEDGAIFALTLSSGAGEDDGETAIAIADRHGNLEILADAEGVDDRPTISPDGKTVVFVSGRTGIASLFRTTIAGDPPVQLTNAHLEPGLEREGDPEGFVPPPVQASRISWSSADVVRYDAGGGEYWQVDVRTGRADREGGVR
jgi:hypothetical protein